MVKFPKLFRKIEGRHWIIEQPSEKPEDFPADPLWDVRTKKNTLSVYLIEKDHDVEEVVTILAASRQTYQKFEYVFLEIEEFKKIGLNCEQSDTQTTLTSVNKSHHEVMNITANKLPTIARIIYPKISEKENFGFRSTKEIKQMIESAIKDKKIKESDLSLELKKKLFPK